MQKSKSRLKTIIIAVIVLSIISVFGYIYIAKKNLPQPVAKSESPVDITPLLVAKLQQLVAAGSDSLYHLSVGQLKVDVITSQVSFYKVSLIPDSAVLQKLDAGKKAPDDVFTITLDTLHVTGINVTDFLHKKDIRLDTIFISSPDIRVAHANRPYNAAIRKRDSSTTLYQKLSQQFTSLSIGAVIAKEGNVVSTSLSDTKKTTELRKVNIQVSDILIDSLTQYDSSRFLFSKATDFSCHNYIATTEDSQYVFKIGSFSVSAGQRLFTAKGISLEPKGGKEAFLRKLKTRNDMFTVRFPDVVAKEVDWWALFNRQSLYAKEITIVDGEVKDYFDRSLLSSGKPGRKNNFPQQLLKEVSFPVLVDKLSLKGLAVSYEEFNPDVKKSGTITFDNLSGTINNITNVATRIRAAPQATCSVTGLFMNKVPLTAFFSFNLAKTTGAFSSRFHLGTVPNTLINPVAEPMGMYTLTTGTADETDVAVTGDNARANTSITLRYHDLRIVPLKKDSNNGSMKKKSIQGFFVNTFVIRNSNPVGNQAPHHYDVTVKRDKDGGSFFNFLWQSVLSGIVETIGLPKQFAKQ